MHGEPVAGAECWCDPEFIEPGVYVHRDWERTAVWMLDRPRVSDRGAADESEDC